MCFMKIILFVVFVKMGRFSFNIKTISGVMNIRKQNSQFVIFSGVTLTFFPPTLPFEQ